jgi:hypothetical protein
MITGKHAIHQEVPLDIRHKLYLSTVSKDINSSRELTVRKPLDVPRGKSIPYVNIHIET